MIGMQTGKHLLEVWLCLAQGILLALSHDHALLEADYDTAQSQSDMEYICREPRITSIESVECSAHVWLIMCIIVVAHETSMTVGEARCKPFTCVPLEQKPDTFRLTTSTCTASIFPALSDNITEFCQGRSISQPKYLIYELGPQRFGATCTMLAETYNDQNAAFSSKKVAKTSAARAAVLALREEGVLKKRYTTAASSVAPAVPAFGTPLPSPVAAVVANIPTAQPTLSSLVPTIPKEFTIPSPPPASSLVPTLCAELNIAPPTYKFDQTSTRTPDFWDGEARFDHAFEPCLRGAVGKVERIYGKKNAKDKVVQQVLEVLEGVKQQRMAG